MYILNPNSRNIYLLDFKIQKFVKEEIDTQGTLPSRFQSCQTINGNIYLVGGIMNGQIVKHSFELNEYFQLRRMCLMNKQRISAPIQLIKDRYILVAGGYISMNDRGMITKTTEILDIQNN